MVDIRESYKRHIELTDKIQSARITIMLQNLGYEVSQETTYNDVVNWVNTELQCSIILTTEYDIYVALIELSDKLG